MAEDGSAIDSNEDEMTPRNYQKELMQRAVKKNTIIFLPTGSGKTFIAVMVLKQLSAPLSRPYCENGQISLMLVNSVALVEQHAKVLRARTHLQIGTYTGERNVDNWSKEQWIVEFNTHQVLVMTVQILVNLCNSGYLDLNRVNLLIFDECHHGVKDQPMRQVMRSFETLANPPRVLGLTATLLNGNCKPSSVMREVNNLEITYQSTIATVEELQDVIGFSTNPREFIKIFKGNQPTSVQETAKQQLEELLGIIRLVKIETKTPMLQTCNLTPLDPEDGLRELMNLIKDFIHHVDMFGVFGLYMAALCYSIQLERLILHCEDIKLYHLLSYVSTTVTHIKHICEKAMGECSVQEKIKHHVSDQVRVLIEIFREFRAVSEQQLCSIIFVDRRFTAKILCHILKALAADSEFKYIKPEFMVGFNNNPYSATREGLYLSKVNKKVVTAFTNKEINLVVASNVLEEGIDIPNCTLVVKFDKPSNYRSYIQSKGRARHKESFYYVLVRDGDFAKFHDNYKTFQDVEKILNTFLIGKTSMRSDPSERDIKLMYEELKIPPYIVDDARVDLLSSISLLCQYCMSFSCDKYTVYAPEWYQEKMGSLVRVVILMPVPCPIKHPIEGPFVSSIKLAKRAAALYACIQLHKIGELNDDLKPRKPSIDEDTGFLFAHWPEEKEKNAGNTKTKRMHRKEMPNFCRGQLLVKQKAYIHIIHLKPNFTPDDVDIGLAAISDIYSSNLCYGLVTANPLPEICKFPVYVSAGEIQVEFKVNQSTVELTSEQIDEIRRFHVFVFNDVLRILQVFLMLDNSEDAPAMLVVPLRRDSCEIDFSIVKEHTHLELAEEPSRDVKASLEVTAENYLGKIVTPWYRPQLTHYLVTKICEDLNAMSPFPSSDFANFVDYYYEKYKAVLVQPTAPLLFVKALSKRINCVKPRGAAKKRKREEAHEGINEHLIAEMCVKHEFPAPLFVQSRLLPTVLHHVMQLLLAEDLRRKIARDTGVGRIDAGGKWDALALDEHLLNYEYAKPVKPVTEHRHQASEIDGVAVLPSNEDFATLNHEVTVKILEAEYPWKDIEEPKDIDRNLDVTVMDVRLYENFMCTTVSDIERNKKYKPVNPKQQAITYDKEFEPKQIALLQWKDGGAGPQLCEVYASLCTAKSNGLVNLERLETLGDSFLKLITSVYILSKYPDFDEGRSTTLKSKIISNKNLFYLGKAKSLGGYISNSDLFPDSQWLPPGFTVPRELQRKIVERQLSIRNLFYVFIPLEEQITGVLGEETENNLEAIDDPVEVDEENELSSLSGYLKHQYIGDKTIADSVEALIGCYFHSSGIEGAIKLVEWMGIIPESERLLHMLTRPADNPVLQPDTTPEKIDFYIPHWRVVEENLGYHFSNRAFLLQALTHASYSCNRVTHCYERLEFLGDAVLDFLITSFIYEHCGHLDPGQITDLRSALVNNNTFASYTVRCGFHKFLLNCNSKLAYHMDNFAEFQENRGHVIDDTVLILLQETDYNIAEHIDVPKTLGDLFEALVGAVFLDSGKDLNVVWKVVYKIMWKEIDLFSHNVPKNVVRLLYEKDVHPKFCDPVEVPSGVTMRRLEFLLDGAIKQVHGFGDNKSSAKRAAAKIALRLLEKKIM